MSQSRFDKSLGWIGRDLSRAVAQLKRGETWLVLGVISLFFALAYFVFHSALRTDSVLRFLKFNIASCRELSNGPIIFMFCGMIFFFLTVVLTIGEIQRFLEARAHHAHHTARQAAIHATAWGVTAVVIGLAALYYLTAYCA